MFCAIMIIKLPLRQMGNGICAFPLQCCDLFPPVFAVRVKCLPPKRDLGLMLFVSSHPSGDTSVTARQQTAGQCLTLGIQPLTWENPTRLMDFKSQAMANELDYVLGSESSRYKLHCWKACSVVRSTYSQEGDSTLGASRGCVGLCLTTLIIKFTNPWKQCFLIYGFDWHVGLKKNKK